MKSPTQSGKKIAALTSLSIPFGSNKIILPVYKLDKNTLQANVSNANSSHLY